MKEKQRKTVSNRKSNEVNGLLKKLAKERNLVAVPTDKTNSHVTMELETYCKTMREELKKDAVVVGKDKLGEVFSRAKALLTEVDHMMSANERAAINESIRSAAVPTPILLVKDHKKKDKNDEHPVRLICPATNFVAIFDKIGHKAIQDVLDKLGVVHDTNAIVQASDLKEELEKIGIKRDEKTIVSFEISANERAAVNESIRSAAVPTPMPLVKDHKKKDKNDECPVRMICPATNFVAIFDKIGHKAIQDVLDQKN